MTETHRHQLTDPEEVATFLTAGKAIGTIEAVDSGRHFTYRLTYKTNEHGEKDSPIFVGVLSGPDNNSDYRYMGIIGDNGNFRRTARSRIGSDALSFKAFDWFWKVVQKHQQNETPLPKTVRFFHEGRCGRCGQRLTVIQSIERGLGPRCFDLSNN